MRLIKTWTKSFSWGLSVYWHLLLFFLNHLHKSTASIKADSGFLFKVGICLLISWYKMLLFSQKLMTSSLFCMILFHLSGFVPSNFSPKRTELEIISVWNIDFFLPPCVLLMCRHMFSFEWFGFCQFAPESSYDDKTLRILH